MKFKINPIVLYKLINEGKWSKKEIEGFKVVQDTITSSDEEDGGAEHELIIHSIEDDRYFRIHYCDWDISNTDWDYRTETIGERCDLNCEMLEVFPREKTIIVYDTKRK